MKLKNPFDLPRLLPMPWDDFNEFAKQYFEACVKRNRRGGQVVRELYIEMEDGSWFGPLNRGPVYIEAPPRGLNRRPVMVVREQ